MKNIAKRNIEIIKMKELGVTQQEIADYYKITRQRVQQIEASLGLDRKKEIVDYNYKCKECKKDFTTKNPGRIYCSRNCSSSCRKIYRTKEEQLKYEEALREKKRLRARDYYHKKVGKK